MKKIYILLGLVALSTSSCEDYLNTEPIQKIAIEQYYTDEQGITNALAGVYDPLGSEKLYGSQLWWQLDSATDEGYYARNTLVAGTMVYNFDFTAVNVSDFWFNLYDGINRANDLIAHIDLPQMDETQRQQILGEALFLRGYYHFLLVSHFGDVPLRLTPTTSPNNVQIARTPAKDVYAQILKDMTDAEGKVSATKPNYSSRVYKTVVQGVLARVCLQMAGYPLNDTSKYNEALSWSKKVIDSGQHSLNVSFQTTAPAGKPTNYYDVVNPSNGVTTNNAYRQVFITEASDTYDTNELMWEADFKARGGGYNEGGRVGNNIGITFQPVASSPLFGTYCWGFIKGTGKLFRAYDATGADLRRDWALTTYTINNSTAVKNNLAKTIQYGRDCGKWRREYEINLSGDQNYTAINFPILRYADVLLMYAEAENQVNGPTAAAQAAVNQVRRRGYGRTDVSAPYLLSDAATTTAVAGGKAAFQLFIEDERMRELCFEGLRRMDLIRWNKFVTTMKAVSDDMAASPTTGPLTSGNQQYGALAGKNVFANGNKFLLFPIPSLEMASNPLIKQENQNPGY
ncbi:RagB/SusD family nutrient uptake outer membrane protein [Flavobacterium aquiphilum]|uniref:RagB/SusD family nutrient uptake outer membrane protein n=1 Tax=Flavobacterium aquiphilum TaxID=3003261 RepID=UPI0024806C7B|nr:RagB/SusD family nutrient uptake outer membrane protein [Flavobacterium aquiphilum]